MAEEAGREKEEEDLPSSKDPKSEIDRREEENLKFNQQIPYPFACKFSELGRPPSGGVLAT
jgi:hypothetical protein